MLLKWEGFQYATSLKLNIGYYYIQQIKNTSNLCTIVLMCVKYCYKCLTMGVANYRDILQQKMNDLFHGSEFFCAYIDDLLILTKGDWIDHVQKLELPLNKLNENVLQCNIAKSLFWKTKMGYLGFRVTRDGVKPTNKKIRVINNMSRPTSWKYLRRFKSVVNYYRSMGISRSHTLPPLTRITSNKMQFEWTKVKQDSFKRN